MLFEEIKKIMLFNIIIILYAPNIFHCDFEKGLSHPVEKIFPKGRVAFRQVPCH